MPKIRWWLIFLTCGCISAGGFLVYRQYLVSPVEWSGEVAAGAGSQTKIAPAISSDPQYIVMNFATITLLDWAAPEAQWQTEIKPKILTQLHEFEKTLPKGSPQRRLAWSTLMEYMNTPLDIPSETSPYVIKVRRIFELAKEENLPIFVPLNGFQWWDQLPELYNWWDPDGTHTDDRFFARQQNPAEFKQRFIAGYDPANKWNVEWQDWQTPMGLNWRNWGGGGFRLAPPPNIVETGRTNARGLSYRSVQRARFDAIVAEIARQVAELHAEKRADLFVGISIGTEVSLSASVTPQDEFLPYGYRGAADVWARTHQAEETATAAAIPHPDLLELQTLRQTAVRDYLTDLSWRAHRQGIPTQRIYTHVWSEAVSGEPRYVDYAAAAYNVYSRPGLSLYGYATKPFELPVWKKALQQAGLPAWGAVEYSVPKTAPEADLAMAKTVLTHSVREPAAKITVLYNWDEHKDAPVLAALRAALNTPVAAQSCQVPEVVELTAQVEDPNSTTTTFHWNYVAGSGESNNTGGKFKLWKTPFISDWTSPPAVEVAFTPDQTKVAVADLSPGVYSWLVEVTGCQGVLRRSGPQSLVKEIHSPHVVPRWVRWWLDQRS